MKKHSKKILAGMVVCLIFLFVMTSLFGCKFAFLRGEPKNEIFITVIDKEEIAIQLPQELLKNKFTIVENHEYWNAKLCVLTYGYNENDDPGFEYVNFWYTYQEEKVKIFAIVWAFREDAFQEIDMKGWLRDERGIPIIATREEINGIIEKLYSAPSEEKPSDSI